MTKGEQFAVVVMRTGALAEGLAAYGPSERDEADAVAALVRKTFLDAYVTVAPLRPWSGRPRQR